MRYILTVLLTMMGALLPLCATVDGLYSDHMVLQRHVPLSFSGVAAPGERVKVSLADISAEVRADRCGHWSVLLPALPAGGPFDLQLGSTTYHDVYVGEVWLCSGQSNMEFRLSNDAEFHGGVTHSDPNGPAPVGDGQLARGTAHPRLHLLTMQPRWLTYNWRWSETACDSVDRLIYYDTSRGWRPCTEQEASRFSAVAYYFGRELADSLDGVHVGLINNSVGGSPTESWISEATLREAQPAMLEDWQNNELVQDWVRLRSSQNVGKDGHRHPYQPHYLYDAGIKPLADYGMRGAIWYQGESNAQDVAEHELLLPLMLADWRATLTSPESMLPLYMVQLSSIAPRLTWPDFRDSQRRLANSMPGVWMAVSSDVGDSLDVHPRLKRPVGHRLAALALTHTYGKPTDQRLPTEPTSYTLRPGCLLLHFGGIQPVIARAPQRTFEVQTPEGEWVEARPSIVGQDVRLDYSKAFTPVAVRYAWQPFTRANVTSPTAWPLSTFKLTLTK